MAVLAWKGINYDTGTNYSGSGLSRQAMPNDSIRRDLAAIRVDLHCNSVSLFGTDIGRLTETARMALEAGLHVWIQPRLVEAEPDAMLDHLAEAAEVAERSAKLASPDWWPRFPDFSRELNDLLGRATAVARSRFGGRLTYGAGLWEDVGWDGFDIVGLNYYRMSYNDADYVTNLRKFHRHGKPIVITEFGCCAFDGAAEMGPTGYGIIDWMADPPQLAGEFTRNEQVQADYLSEQLGVFEAEGIHGAYVFEFIGPKPHSADPRYDLDMASFGVVKVIGDGWEPKAAFRELGRVYGMTR